ncbi:MAG: XRE family transcriptional regulator [Alkalicoccus sp.]|nr:MAG: XRE family transcriptional regulator [Alkalicoccus sp.]
MVILNKQQLGKEIAALRKRKKLSQGQLAEGICTQPAVSQIEKGLVYPKVDTLYYLAAKLDTSFSHFVNLLMEENLSWEEEVQHLENLIAEQKHKEICSYVQKLREKNGQLEEWISTFTSWAFSLSKYHCGDISLKRTIQELKQLYSMSDSIVLKSGNLHVRILNSIAFLHALNKDYSQSLYYYDKILEDGGSAGEKKGGHERTIYQIRVMYNKAKTLYDMKEAVKSLQVIEDGIRLSLQNENMSLLGQFYYYKGQCFEHLKREPEETAECYEKALFLFELLNKKLYSRLVWEHKSHYIT